MDKQKAKEILDEWRSKYHVEWTDSGYAPVYDKNNEELAQAICQLDEQEVCPECKGEGFILDTYAEADNDEYGGSHDVQAQVPCPACQGTGKAKPVIRVRRRDIAKECYLFRCEIPDEYLTEWDEESSCIKQSCLKEASRIINLIRQLNPDKTIVEVNDD